MKTFGSLMDITSCLLSAVCSHVPPSPTANESPRRAVQKHEHLPMLYTSE
jgi:hypothetical protein